MRPPDVASGAVRAWRIPQTAATEPDHAAALDTWVLNGPFHPFWRWWFIGLVSLRDIPGVRPANKQYPGAEYELMIISLNPERGTPDIEAIDHGRDWGKKREPKFLTPLDLQFQFDGVTEQQAIRLCEDAIRAIVSGILSPDQDYRSAWHRSLTATLDHFRAGLHREASA